MPKRLAWEKNWLHAHGWTWAQIDQLEQSGDLTPVEYLTGWAAFADLELQVNRHTLIPRLETEQLVALAADYYRDHFPAPPPAGKFDVVDVGTGSGVIAISLARRLPAARLLATDISPEALAVASANVQRFALADRIHLVHSDLLSHVDTTDLTPAYLLVANLPYIPTTDYQQLDDSVLAFEPRLALDGGDDGFALISRLLSQINDLPARPAAIFLEVDPSHDLPRVATCRDYTWQRVTDAFGRPRFLVGISTSI